LVKFISQNQMLRGIKVCEGSIVN